MENKTISFIFVFLFSITLVSAIAIYSGESITIELEKPYAYYSVVGNSSEVVLDVVQNGNFVTITPGKYSSNDSYEIIFFDIEKETITVYESSGGGGSRTRWRTEYVDKNVTEYIDKEITTEVPGETIETEKVVAKTSWLTWTLIFILVVIIFYTVIGRFKNDE